MLSKSSDTSPIIFMRHNDKDWEPGFEEVDMRLRQVVDGEGEGGYGVARSSCPPSSYSSFDLCFSH